uniref:Uncharacterized protein n=1 Tax=Nelumbo nucifera TaxID=4432 RepID=A0A822ZT57_NELNU|nr:TPA_asm: hypothetical protein HUJ06_016436 [Nelumbo nucifera]
MAEPSGPHYEFIVEDDIAASESQGIVVNSFCELETIFIEYWDREHFFFLRHTRL